MLLHVKIILLSQKYSFILIVSSFSITKIKELEFIGSQCLIVLVASSNDNQTGPTSDKLSSRTTRRRLRTERSKLLI